MKPSNEIRTVHTISTSRARFHWLMVMVGLMTALISTMVLLHDFNTAQSVQTNGSGGTYTSNVAKVDLTSTFKNLSVVSVIWTQR